MSLGAHRDQFLKIAESWESLAREAERRLGQSRPTPPNDSDDRERF
jgi:hypothetical protein